ncbi:alpha/beta fold hydrolase [Conexibacter arvalis]|uniref:Pimeloyl-ACP methyl ester carboxylesterase n=1 Tax=Conexibacter arvalis TaxID=912552 RepID=A0A840II65_9ACTN|nr:alpha/beta fold hydrolase [Conexibacter arvalis]MBB4663638.1 pimeloyl-ACP methyl ester carboxylesterase [Conexibacter arvalis]
MLVHDRRGAGPPLVLIHGIGARRGAWDPVAERLAGDRETFAIDLPGFGDSPSLPLSGELPIGAYVDAVERFFADVGLERPHVAGNSMGGGIALELARRGAVASATALSPVGFWNQAESVWSRAVLRASRLGAKHAGGLLRRVVASAPGRVVALGVFYGRPAALDAAVAREDLRMLGAAPAFDRTLGPLGRYRFADGAALDGVPVTIGWGARDRLLLYPSQPRRARAALPRARHVVLERCGHLPMHDDPDQVAALLRVASARGA